jgi:hypothetical protein
MAYVRKTCDFHQLNLPQSFKQNIERYEDASTKFKSIDSLFQCGAVNYHMSIVHKGLPQNLSIFTTHDAAGYCIGSYCSSDDKHIVHKNSPHVVTSKWTRPTRAGHRGRESTFGSGNALKKQIYRVRNSGK